MPLILKKFDISSIKEDTVIVFIGKRNVGISYLINDIIYENKIKPVISNSIVDV